MGLSRESEPLEPDSERALLEATSLVEDALLQSPLALSVRSGPADGPEQEELLQLEGS